MAQFVDAFPGISAALLDHARRPKRAYRTIADAFRPVLLCVDLPEAGAGVDGLLLRLPRGRLQIFRILCVNDDPKQGGPARLRWRIQRERAYKTSPWRELRGWFARRRFRGQEAVVIPDQLDPAGIMAEPVVRLHADGLYRVSAQLDVNGTVVAELEQRFLVGAPARPAEQVSGWRPALPIPRDHEALVGAPR